MPDLLPVLFHQPACQNLSPSGDKGLHPRWVDILKTSHVQGKCAGTNTNRTVRATYRHDLDAVNPCGKPWNAFYGLKRQRRSLDRRFVAVAETQRLILCSAMCFKSLYAAGLVLVQQCDARNNDTYWRLCAKGI